MNFDKKEPRRKFDVSLPQILIPAVAVIFTLLITVGVVSKKSEEKVMADSEQFTTVSKEYIGNFGPTVYTLKHKKTGCYYTVVKGDREDVSITPLYTTTITGTVQIPYCKK
jgi:hypothetical protein